MTFSYECQNIGTDWVGEETIMRKIHYLRTKFLETDI